MQRGRLEQGKVAKRRGWTVDPVLIPHLRLCEYAQIWSVEHIGHVCFHIWRPPSAALKRLPQYKWYLGSLSAMESVSRCDEAQCSELEEANRHYHSSFFSLGSGWEDCRSVPRPSKSENDRAHAFQAIAVGDLCLTQPPLVLRCSVP